MMGTFSIIKNYIVILLSVKGASSVLTGHERKSNYDSNAEEKEWVTSFGPSLPYEQKFARETDVSSNSLCPSGVTGQFPYPQDCKRFVNCWKGRGMIQVCAPGTLFNPATGECDYPDKVSCGGYGYVASPQPLVSRFPYQRPSIGQNPRISRKDKDNYQTGSQVIRPNPGRPFYLGASHLTRPTPVPTTPTGIGAKLKQKVECPPGSSGLFPHPTDCTKFLNCYTGGMFIQRCGPGTYFNPLMNICDHMQPNGCGDNQEQITSDVTVPTPKEVEVISEKDEEQYPPIDDLYNSGTNLFDVRAGVEEDFTEKPEELVTEKLNIDHSEKKERESKILTWGNRKSQPDGGNTLFYDAFGKPVSSTQFWSSFGKEQPEAGQNKPQNGQNTWVDSNVYYVRPHNHVMNQHPPYLQNNYAVKQPNSNSPNSQTVRGHRDPPINPYYPTAPVDSTIAGHYILVDDRKPIGAKKTNEDPPTYLVPPAPDYNFKPSEPKVGDRHQVPEKPPIILLPPPVDDQIHNQPTQHNPQVKLEYGNWKPSYSQKVLPTELPQRTTQTFNGDPSYWNDLFGTKPAVSEVSQERWKVHHDKAPAIESTGKPIPDRWSHKTQITDVVNRRNISQTTTSRTVDNWSPYFENKNPYRFSSPVTRTFSTVTVPTPPPTTSSTTIRVYPVYAVHPERTNETEYGSYYNAKTEKPNRLSEFQKLKDSGRDKLTEDDHKKRIKAEAEIVDSQENWDVDILPFEELLPEAGKQVRLKPLSGSIGGYHLDGYIEMKNLDGKWGLVCDKTHGWMMYEANIACKELGYGRGAQISWQGFPQDTSTESIPVTVSEVRCRGDEESLGDCLIDYGDNGCDITENAVGVRCFDNVTTQCHPEEVEFNNSCYRLVKRDDVDDIGLTIDEAAEFCNKIGGRISDIVSQEENDFISEWLMNKHPNVKSVLTGGIGSAFMGRSIWMWFSSKVPMIYQNWWKGWADENKVKQGNVHEPLCVVLRKSYPCYSHAGEETPIEIELGNLEPEYCSTNYFYWDVEQCKKLRQMKLPHLCKKPLEDIGCVSGRGEGYSGKASVTSSGAPCLPWDHPEVKERLAHRITLQEWTTKLSGHNFCRNLGRQELHPWCFVEGKENSEYCSIPQCSDSVPGYSKSATSNSSCEETQFECLRGECIDRNLFCDGNRDCSNGRDEAMCSIFLEEFTKIPQKRMWGHGKEERLDVTEKNCVKLCLENKKFKCKSFSYNKEKRTCLLSDVNIGLSGLVVDADGWAYHELSRLSLNCSTIGLSGCRNGKCVNVTDVCDGENDCGDNSDEEDCEKLGYEVRLTGSNGVSSGRLEIKVLGHWGGVCYDKFTSLAGHVACRELGFKHGFSGFLKNSTQPTYQPSFLVDEVNCFGNESSLRECKFSGWEGENCKSGEAVGLNCRVPQTECPDDQWLCKKSEECIQIRYLCDRVYDCDDRTDEDEEICNEPVKIRLAGGPNETSGRLEVRYSGTWGTICDDNFNDAAATVLCRTLGYLGPAYAIKNAHFGQGKGPIWLDGIQCLGNETNVDQCLHEDWGNHNCKHDEDISLSCSALGARMGYTALKPIATSTDEGLELTSSTKLKQVLLKECSDDGNGNLAKISHSLERVVKSNVVHQGIPWQASIRVRSKDGRSTHWCGAIVISPYHILTAGHCVRDYSKPAYVIRVGDFDTERDDPEEKEFAIDHLYVHPDFNHDFHLNNDIALIKVKGEIPLGSRVKPACLAPSTDLYIPGTNCSISGWGSVTQDSRGYARTLRRGYVPILEPSQCRSPAVYGNSLSDGMFCAGHLEGGVDSCQGDSGGPITCRHKGKEYLYGITSWGHGCGKANKPGVYTNVAYYSQWLQEKIEISMA